MKFGPLPLSQAEGTLVAHKIYDADGRILFKKGHRLSAEDIETLNRASFDTLVTVRLEEGDIHENDAAARIGHTAAGPHIEVKAVGAGRAHLTAAQRGVLHIDVDRLHQINANAAGVTLSTVRNHSFVEAGDMVTLVKIVPFAIPQEVMALTQHLSSELIQIKPIKRGRVALIISGPEALHNKLIGTFDAPVRDRISYLGSQLESIVTVPHDIHAVSQAMRDLAEHDLILLVSYTAVMDEDDIIPAALAMAGGEITHFGLPVDPGTLLMMGYLEHTAVMAAPGCMRTPKINAIDHLLPRVLSGERLQASDLTRMGHGGLLGTEQAQPLHRRDANKRAHDG